MEVHTWVRLKRVFLERVESGESVVVSISGVEEWQSLQ